MFAQNRGHLLPRKEGKCAAVVVSHGLAKQHAAVPTREIERAIERETRFKANPQAHTFIPPEN